MFVLTDWHVLNYQLLNLLMLLLLFFVHAGSPSRGGDVAVSVFDINQPSLPTSFYSVLVPVSAFMAHPTVFLSIYSPDNPPFSHSVLLVFICLIGPFNYTSLYERLPQP